VPRIDLRADDERLRAASSTKSHRHHCRVRYEHATVSSKLPHLVRKPRAHGEEGKFQSVSDHPRLQKSHRGVKATGALAAIKKAHPGQKINEGTFKATFYKLAGGGGHGNPIIS
jgi:hypothetical protein